MSWARLHRYQLAPSEPGPYGVKLATAALAEAIRWIGRGEGPPGNNQGADVWQLTNRHGTGPDKYRKTKGAWCAAAVSYWYEAGAYKAGLRVPFKRSHSAKGLYKRVGKAGRFVEVPAPGDVICWNRGRPGAWTGHIGIVERYLPDTKDGRTVHAVEGNVGPYPALVKRRVHYIDDELDLIGFASVR